MGRNDIVIGAKVNIEAEIGNFEKGLKQIQNDLKQLHFSDGVKESFNAMFSNFEKEISTLKEKTKNNQVNLIDENSIKTSFNKIEDLYTSLIKKIKSEGGDATILEKDVELIKILTEQVKKYNEAISESGGKIEKATKDYEDQAKVVKALKTLKDEAERKVMRKDLQVQNEESKLKSIQKQYEVQEQLAKQAKEEEEAVQKSVKWYETRISNLKKRQEDRKSEAKTEYLDRHNGRPQGFEQQYNAQNRSQLEEEEKKIAEYTQKQAEAQDRLTKAHNQAERASSRLVAAKMEVRDEENKQTDALTKAKQAQEDATTGLQNATGNYDAAIKKLNEFSETIDELKGEEFEQIKTALDGLDWSKFGVPKPVINSQEELSSYISKLTGQSQQAASALVQGLEPALQGIKESGQAAKQGAQEAAEGAKKVASTQSDLERMTNRFAMFFSIDNMVRLFRRAIKSATDAIKDLDKVMTETAVVTEFSVGDMWKQLPDYTKRANELGLAVRDVYQASTLYYQQGLQTNEVMQVTNATLRMARIASLDASEATDRMTNALRGFNMEINETNADNVADVYSKLAAISASNVDEISTAMTKVASLANNANMSFENTAAFLSQIIETTRESAETAGTALKTVIARFSEVKELRTKGELLGTDEEGEEIDVNKVSEALRSAGINLNEYLTGAKGLDDIFMELASKWDSLDMVQQRYIATMAAGSRQQSRFIALMSDYKRTQELTTAAQKASGASMEQYEKTLESIETKLNRLKNAWNEFLMGIANDQFVRGFLDAITNILSAINKLTDGISGGNGLIKSIANIGVAFGGLKLGGSIVKTLFGDPRQKTTGWLTDFILGFKKDKAATKGFLEIAKTWGVKLSQGMQGGFGSTAGDAIKKGLEKVNFSSTFKGFKDNLNSWFRKSFSSLSASDLGLDKVNLSEARNFKWSKFAEINQEDLAKAWNLDEGQAIKLKSASMNFQLGTYGDQNGRGLDIYKSKLKELGITEEATAKQADMLGASFKNQNQALNITSVAMTATGATLMGLGAIIEKVTGSSTPFTKMLKVMGGALMAFGALLPSISAAFKKFGVDVSTTIMNIPIIGWIAAVISAVIALITLLVTSAETQSQATKRVQQTLQDATQAVNEAKDAVDNLKTSYDELVESANKIDTLTTGTKEWTEAVKKNNEEVLKLMASYKGLKISNENGVLKIENYDEVLADYEKSLSYAELGQVGANINVADTQKTFDQTLEYVNRLVLEKGTIGEEGYERMALTDNQKNLIVEAVGKGIVNNSDQLKDYIQQQFGMSAIDPTGGDLIGDEQIYKQFQESAKTYLENEEKLKSFGTALGAVVSSLTDLDEESQQYAQNFLSNGKLFSDLYTEERGKLTRNGLWREEHWDGGDETIRADYKRFLEETYHVTTFSSNGDFTAQNGDTKHFKDDDVRNAFASWRAAQKAADQLEDYTKTITKSGASLAKAFEGQVGQNLTQNNLGEIYNEITELKGANILDLDKPDSALSEALKEYWAKVNDLSIEEIAQLDTNEAYIQWSHDLVNNVNTAQTALDYALDNFSEAFNTATSNFTSGTINKLVNQLKEYKPDDRGVFGTQIVKWFETNIGDENKLEGALQAFSTVALNSEEQLNSFKNTLKTMGINVADKDFQELLNTISSGVHAIAEVDIEKTKEQLEDFSKVISDIRSGEQKRNFSKDIYDKMVEAGVDESIMANFTKLEDGSYLYIGDKLDEVVDAINKQTADLLGKGAQQLQAKEFTNEAALAAGEKVSKTKTVIQGTTQGTVEQVVNKTQEEYNRDYLQAIINEYRLNKKDIGDLGISGLYSNDIDLSLVGEELLSSWVTQVNEIAANKTYWGQELEKLKETEGVTTLMKNTLDTLVSEFANASEEDQEKYRATILSKVGSSGFIPEDIMEQYITTPMTSDKAQELSGLEQAYKEAKDEGLDINEVEKFAQSLAEAEQISLDVATKVAVANSKLNKGVGELISSYDDWSDLVGEDGPLGKGMDKLTIRDSEQSKSFATLKKNLSQALNVEEELSDQFFADEKNIKNLEKLINGTAEEKTQALENLQKAAAVDFVGPATEQTSALINYLQNLDIPDIEVGATLKNDEFFTKLQAMTEAAGVETDKILELLGFKGEEVPDGYYTYATPNPEGPPTLHKVPKTKMVYTRLNGGRNWAGLSGSNLNTTGAKDSVSKESSSKPKQWKNPYDELYNKQQEINTALRERERLEHKYQDMLEDHTKTSEDLVKNNLAQIASLKRQIQLQQQLLKGRQRQLANVANETYEDSEGNRTTYAAMGVMRYVTYDEETREINIDWNELNKVTDENLGGAIEAYVSRLEELLSAQNEIEDTIEELNDTVDEINSRGREEYLDFEQSVYEAIVGEREAEIEALENVSQTIKDAADKTIQSVQDEIDKERQLRENEKEEQSILDKQMRLAYLRRDTSGANALEIKKLEEELANDTQSYQDKIIDQTIQQMQDDAAKAAEQREQQIDLLRQSLEIDKATGEIWNKVNEYIAGGIDKDGSLIKGSKLEKLLKESADYTGMSRFGKENWDDDMAKKIAQAMMGVQSWELKEGKESGKLTLGDDNGTVLRYNPKKGTWYNTRTGESYTDDDLEYDYSKGKMVLKSKTSNQSQTSETSKSGPHKVIANGVPTEMYDVNDGHVAWTTAGGEQFDLVSEDGEDYIVANEQGARYRTRKKGWKKENGFVWNAYAQGGLVDTTGPAWLDGSKSRPEMVLDAADTRNLITLKNVLASILNNAKSSNANQMGGDNYFNIDIQAEIDSDYDVDQLADRIKKQIYDDASYRNVNVISTMR